MSKISSENFDYLNKIAVNNNREWFAENKEEYLKQHQNMIEFADDLLLRVNKHDNIETLNGKKSLYRIYRDVRFSKNKDPYKTHWAGGFKRATKQLRGGYYFHIAPGNNSMIAGGFWNPNKEDLLRIREDIAIDNSELLSIISNKKFVATFDELKGEQLKTAPKGFPKDHKAIDLLRFKQFIVWRNFTDKEVLSNNFTQLADNTFKTMRPFLDYMSEVLTTDLNGSPIT